MHTTPERCKTKESMQAGSAESAQISWELPLHLAASTMKAPTTVAHTVRFGMHMYVY